MGYQQTALYDHLWLTPPNDVDRLAEAMISATRLTTQARRELGIAARRMVIDNYDEKQCKAQLSAFYERVLQF